MNYIMNKWSCRVRGQLLYLFARVQARPSMFDSSSDDLTLALLERAAALGNMRAHEQAAGLYLGEASYCMFNIDKALLHLEALEGKESPRPEYLRGKYKVLMAENVAELEVGYDCLRNAAKAGYVQAQYYLGWRMVDYCQYAATAEEGERWLICAANAGHEKARRELAAMYRKGEKIPEAPEKSFYWIKKLAEHGDAGAAYELGIYYLDGYGVDKQPDKARKWLLCATRRKDSEIWLAAVSKLSQIKEDPKSQKLGFKLLAKEYEKTYCREADLTLAECYISGYGIEPDIQKGTRILQQAADSGDEDALELLVQMGDAGKLACTESVLMDNRKKLDAMMHGFWTERSATDSIVETNEEHVQAVKCCRLSKGDIIKLVACSIVADGILIAVIFFEIMHFIGSGL